MVTGKKMALFDEETDKEIFDEDEWYFVELGDLEMKTEPSIETLNDIPETDSDVESAQEFQEIVLPQPMELKDIIKEDILPWLPAKALTRFKSVSKSWNFWIKSPVLAHRQSYTHKSISGFFSQPNYYSEPDFFTFNQSSSGIPNPSLSFLPISTYIVGSTHGLLVCRAHSEPDLYYICNPVTRTFRKLLSPGLYHGLDSACVLAFDPALTNIESFYQLVCAVPLVGQPVICFETYSSKTGSWACSDAICPMDEELSGHGLYMNGMAYWKTNGGKVVAFDTKTEVCGVVALPHGSPARGALVEMNGQLAYVGISELCYGVEMYYGVEMGLRRRVELFGNVGGFRGCYFGVLPYCEEGKVMVVNGGLVYCCGLEDEGIEEVGSWWWAEFTESTRFFPYVNTLVHVG
ncbi:F-box family protein [Striga asiatica]|uniref:F-box family protein n=1 Tax=Striga asiatica TaxID=4170 RepID=A0A5A7QCQ5_STRAF|nr:F-box family protein [Striga asiatica]